MKKLLIEIDDILHKKIKLYVAKNGISIKQLVTDLIKEKIK